eukprot:SAG25_NODE_270_length_10627_cov_13.114267_6_plen_123_part_00
MLTKLVWENMKTRCATSRQRQLGQIIEQPDVRPYVNATTQLEIRKSFPGLLEPVGVRAGTQADITGDTRKRERDPTVRDAGPPKFEMRTINLNPDPQPRPPTPTPPLNLFCGHTMTEFSLSG